jgi:cytochrome c oxidase cbb3-type subunit 3
LDDTFLESIFFTVESVEKYRIEVAKFEEASAEPEEEVVAANLSAEEIAELELKRDLDAGAKIYKNFCATCHLEKGQGMTGPNLTDEYWIHGGNYDDIVKTITDGVIEKGMIPWKSQLSAKKIDQVAKFIQSLEGTNPPNPKAPEGEKYVAQ